jgi:competence protein ComEC
VLLGVLLLVYASAAGMQPPIVRSVLMMGVFFCAYMVRRGSDGLSALAFAGALSLIWAPELVRDIGFQLSMVAVGSLVMFVRAPEGDEGGLREWALRYAEASIVVTLATAPLLAYHFGTVPLMSLPANMLVVPVLGVVIAGALASWVVWLVLPAVGLGLLKVSVEPMTGWVVMVIEGLGSLPFASLAVPEFSAWWLLPVYVAACSLWRPHVRPA